MRIAFDAKRIFHNTSGLGNYGRNLINSLEQYYPDNDYLLFTPRNGRVPFKPASSRILYPDTNTPALWRSFSIIRQIAREQPDIYHGLSNELPFTMRSAKCRSAVSVHDVIFRRYPEAYGIIDRNIYHYKTRFAIRHADVIFTSSQATANDLEQLYGADPGRMVVLFPGVEQIFYEPAEPSAVTENLPTEFFLFVGLGNRRKNFEIVLEALSRQSESQRIPVVAVHGPGKYASAMRLLTTQRKLEKWVHFIPSDNAGLRALYHQAVALIYPSLYEGFGMPVAEALVCNCAVLASDRSSIPEAGGNAALYFDPEHADALADAMFRIQDDQFRANCIQKGIAYRERFTPEVLAGTAMDAYRRLI